MVRLRSIYRYKIKSDINILQKGTEVTFWLSFGNFEADFELFVTSISLKVCYLINQAKVFHFVIRFSKVFRKLTKMPWQKINIPALVNSIRRFYGVQILSYHGMCVRFVMVRAACLNKKRTLIDNTQ